MSLITSSTGRGVYMRRPVKVLAIAIGIALAALALGRPVSAAPDNQGDAFMLGFMDSLATGSGGTFLFLTGPTATTATVEAPGIGFGPTAYPIVPGSITTVSLSAATRSASSGTIETKGISVSAPEEFSVYGLNQQSVSTDAFLGLPEDIQGTDYIVPSFRNRSSGLVGELMIVGIADGTSVTITPTTATVGGSDVPAIAAGSSATVVLDRFETLQIKAAGFTGPDLTGTEVVSSAPISVFGGHKCADVPGFGTPYCDTLVEQIPPTTTWGKSFLTVPLATRTGGDIFRVTSAVDGNVVSLDGAPVATIDRGEFHELDLASGTFHEIETTEAANLMQYSKGSTADSKTADPFMMMIPPTEQFASDYTVGTPASSPVAFSNYINIVAPTADLAGLTLDGAPIGTVWTPIGGSGHSGTQVPVSIGSHTVKHASPIVPFGLYSYGWASFDSYGYPAGLRLAPLGDSCSPTVMVPADGVDNECDGKIDEELPNGIDDDGDGLIDEDLAVACIPTAMTPGDGVDNDCDGAVDEETADGVDNDADGLIDEDLGLIGPPPGCSSVVTYAPDGSTFTSSTTPVASGAAGTFGFDAVLTNTGSHALSGFSSEIAILTNGNLLLSADNGAGAVGDVYTLPLVGDYADGILSPGESAAIPHLIGLAAFEAFDFFVDIDCSVAPIAP